MPAQRYFDGNRIGPKNILLVKRTRRDGKRYYGEFECPFCGKHFETKIDNIVSGNTVSCGCLIPKKKKVDSNIDLTGLRVGKLLVLGLDENMTAKKKGRWWKCQCDCGVKKSFKTTSLIDGSSKQVHSCGCAISGGEVEITNILVKNNIKFITQATFESLKKIERLRFDFYLPELNILIECQGMQHYKPVEFFGGEKAFKELCERDNLKRKWCIENNKRLIEIPYFHSGDIKEDKILALLGLA